MFFIDILSLLSLIKHKIRIYSISIGGTYKYIHNKKDDFRPTIMVLLGIYIMIHFLAY